MGEKAKTLQICVSSNIMYAVSKAYHHSYLLISIMKKFKCGQTFGYYKKKTKPCPNCYSSKAQKERRSKKKTQGSIDKWTHWNSTMVSLVTCNFHNWKKKSMTNSNIHRIPNCLCCFVNLFDLVITDFDQLIGQNQSVKNTFYHRRPRLRPIDDISPWQRQTEHLPIQH